MMKRNNVVKLTTAGVITLVIASSFQLAQLAMQLLDPLPHLTVAVAAKVAVRKAQLAILAPILLAAIRVLLAKVIQARLVVRMQYWQAVERLL